MSSAPSFEVRDNSVACHAGGTRRVSFRTRTWSRRCDPVMKDVLVQHRPRWDLVGPPKTRPGLNRFKARSADEYPQIGRFQCRSSDVWLDRPGLQCHDPQRALPPARPEQCGQVLLTRRACVGPGTPATPPLRWSEPGPGRRSPQHALGVSVSCEFGLRPPWDRQLGIATELASLSAQAPSTANLAARRQHHFLGDRLAA